MNNKQNNEQMKQLLKLYKLSGMIKVKRIYEGRYEAIVNNKIFTIESVKNREEKGSQWIVTSEDSIDWEDNYINHYNSLSEAQFELVQIVD